MIVGKGKHRRIVRLASVDTLVTLAKRGERGRAWYHDAKREVFDAADMLGVPRWVFADYLALFSPRVSVRRSIRMAIHYATTGDHTHGVMRGVKAAVNHYEETAEIRGPKTSAFARALLGEGDAVVLDVWMAKAFRIDPKLFAFPAVYRECADRIRRAADRLGWSPAETQAAVWCAAVTDAGRNAPRFTIVENILWGSKIAA